MNAEVYEKLVIFPTRLFLLVAMVITFILWMKGHADLNQVAGLLGLSLGTADFLNGTLR